MLTKEDIQLLSQLMDEKLDQKLKPIKEELSEIKENTEITRSVLIEVVKWIDVNFREDYPFPTEDKKAI